VSVAWHARGNGKKMRRRDKWLSEPVRILATMWFDPHTISFEDDPYPVYRRLRDEEPVHRYGDTEPLWVLARFDDVSAAIADWHTFSSVGSTCYRGGEIDQRQLITTDPPVHDALRRTTREHFSPKAVAALEDSIRAETASLLEAVRGTESLDVAGAFAWQLTVAVISGLLGIPESDQAPLLGWYQARTYSDDAVRAAEGQADFDRYFDELAAERLARPTDDFTGHLMRLVEAGEVDETDAIALLRDVFEGGVDVPANLIANAVLALAERPEQRAHIVQAREDTAAARLAVEELARFETPIQYIPRIATADVELHGELIPSGATVLLLLGSANHDERQFEEPELLDVTRRATRTVAFGAGVHFCIGAPLARLEARLALPELLAVLPEYDVVEPVRRPRGDPVMRALLSLEVAR
jgi:cytochrome P450